MYINLTNQYNILCIDDNENNLFTLSALLKSITNINPITANSADKGLKIVLKERIDLILLDVQMPIMNGFEAAQLLKKNKLTRDIPIIFITAVFKSEEFVKEGFDIGAIDYLTKPIDDMQLINKIALYLKIFDKTKLLEHSEKKFYSIAQSISDGIYTLDLESKVTFINEAALKLLGFSSKELMGKNMHDFIHYKDMNNNPLGKNLCKIHNSLVEGTYYNSESDYFIRKDGTFLEVSVMATPLFEEKKITGLVVVFRDKTNQNRIISLEKEKIKNQEQIIHSMVGMIESRDSYTAGHTKRVAYYCEMIARDMGCREEDIELLKKAAWLHDIGKISTPDNVLLKPTKLNEIEYELIKDHLLAGYNILQEIDDYKEIAAIMVQHHERYDGEGYPYGLKADEITLPGRIMIVADAFDAMTTNRVYKTKKSVQVALKELEELSGKQFHPEVVNIAIATLRDIVIDDNISQLPKSKIEEQRFSYFYRDKLTNLFVIEYLQLILRYNDFSNALYFYNIKLHNFSQYNKEKGWAEGNKLLVAFAAHLELLYKNKLIFRVEGDDFLILSKEKIEDIDDNFNKSSLLENISVHVTIEEKYSNDLDTIKQMIELYS
jgi:PAS domain S-box-containing protein/putative nucleotidyltransferase with HDIG domain